MFHKHGEDQPRARRTGVFFSQRPSSRLLPKIGVQGVDKAFVWTGRRSFKPNGLPLQLDPGIASSLWVSADAPEVTHAWCFHPGSRAPNRSRGQALAWHGEVTQRLTKLANPPHFAFGCGVFFCLSPLAIFKSRFSKSSLGPFFL